MTDDELQAIEARIIDRTIRQPDAAALVAEVRRCVEALRAIINASDDCQGHRYCDHSMKPWGDARIIVHEFDGDAEALDEQRRLMATHPRYNE